MGDISLLTRSCIDERILC